MIGGELEQIPVRVIEEGRVGDTGIFRPVDLNLLGRQLLQSCIKFVTVQQKGDMLDQQFLVQISRWLGVWPEEEADLDVAPPHHPGGFPLMQDAESQDAQAQHRARTQRRVAAAAIPLRPIQQ